MNVSVPLSSWKKYFRIKTPSFLRINPNTSNSEKKIKSWMAFWYTAEKKAMDDANNKMNKEKKKLGDKLESQIPKIEEERQKKVIETLAKELDASLEKLKNTKKFGSKDIGPNHERLVDMAKAIKKMQLGGQQSAGEKQTRRHVRCKS